MIQALNVTKKFENMLAVDNVSATIKNGNVFGLIGTNGAGKSTFLRMISGILKPDSGSIKINDKDVFDNPEVKSKFFYISDEQFFFSNSTPQDMKNYYKTIYKNFDVDRYKKLMGSFNLDEKRKIKTFSKGMKKQVSVICGICAKTDYLFCDETFDGLDPVVRQAVKSLFAQDIEERNLTPVIASHNLREIEDICDNIGLLHRGGMLLSKDLDELKLDIHKVQIVFKEGIPKDIYNNLDIMKTESRGSLNVLTIKGNMEYINGYLASLNPIFFEMLPLSLEEIFIAETEGIGYDIKSLII
ncbi:ABC transporter ATP-binding protein [uncultured Tyzzerella sp.]|uniref:ABC transporter ATP-binding protein n=1 Tax=uncultured Tyzzerella sp. TaxID=2321398 RepID=UPI002942293E|nr:ABC transporter ATP-binding protein [uncultured Tyzzerella sp.]